MAVADQQGAAHIVRDVCALGHTEDTSRQTVMLIRCNYTKVLSSQPQASWGLTAAVCADDDKAQTADLMMPNMW